MTFQEQRICCIGHVDCLVLVHITRSHRTIILRYIILIKLQTRIIIRPGEIKCRMILVIILNGLHINAIDLARFPDLNIFVFKIAQGQDDLLLRLAVFERLLLRVVVCVLLLRGWFLQLLVIHTILIYTVNLSSLLFLRLREDGYIMLILRHFHFRQADVNFLFLFIWPHAHAIYFVHFRLLIRDICLKGLVWHL